MKLASIEAIARALNDAGVPFIVVGGLAVNAHGYGRATQDIDLVISLDPGAVRAAFQALGTLMALGLLLLPAVAASFWARQVVTMALVALPMAAMSGLVGLLISYHTSVPSGPAIVLVASLFYIASLLLGTNDSVRMRLVPPAHLRA